MIWREQKRMTKLQLCACLWGMTLGGAVMAANAGFWLAALVITLCMVLAYFTADYFKGDK